MTEPVAQPDAPGLPTWPQRVANFPLVRLIIQFCFVGLSVALASYVTSYLPVGGAYIPLVVVRALVVAGAALAAYRVAVRMTEGTDPPDLKPDDMVRQGAAGKLAGFALMAVTVGIIALAGSYRIAGWNPWQTVWAFIAMATVSGIVEEILLRGIVFRHLETLIGSTSALALSAAFFGALHLGNDNATWLAAGAIAIGGGVLLAAIYMRTRQLWAPMGFHAMWNFAQGWLFGVPVSGNAKPGLVRGQLTGPEWISGGAFGVEASLPSLVVLIAASVAVLYAARQKGLWRAPLWQHAAQPTDQTKL